ncbi:MAG: four helix bundle protein [Chloroflexi bacterium]|nr:four helix bundle protein [Chloroflexota bacterium]
MSDPTPLFTKTFDFITWLMPATNHFPRSQRFLVTERLLGAALDFQELVLEANNRIFSISGGRRGSQTP